MTRSEALLAALADGESYSLELIERAAARGVRIGMLDIYPLLRGLEDEGLARSWDGRPMAERGGRPRRYYALTPAGRERADALR